MSSRAAVTVARQEASLVGRVAIVTGGAGALGRATVEEFTRRGADVVGVDLHGDDCVHADIGTAEGNAAMVAAALERHGRLDILVLNAGAQHMAPIAEFPEEQWHRLLDVMLTGPFLAVRAAWPELIRRSGSRILVTASTPASWPSATRPPMWPPSTAFSAWSRSRRSRAPITA